jgi:protein-L-isoaspartate(D-aspartate) O-methyltransferase
MFPPRRSDTGPGAAIARQVRERGFRDSLVLAALARLDRARFLPPPQRPLAGADQPVPIGLDQTMSQPYMVAVMSSLLELSGAERVLEIGTGSGYQTAVLAALADEVFTVERLPMLSLRARSILDGLGCAGIRYRIGDGTLGWPDEAPFDRILVTAGAPVFPSALFEQLAEGGRMVVPLGDESGQDLCLVRKVQGQPARDAVMSCRFVKLIGAEGWSEDAR